MSNRVLDHLYQAELAVERLVKMNVDVSHVDISGHMRPRIWLRGRDEDIRPKFGGGVHMIQPAANGERNVVMAAPFEGCQLQWGMHS